MTDTALLSSWVRRFLLEHLVSGIWRQILSAAIATPSAFCSRLLLGRRRKNRIV
jgi:hypothetical protein